MGILNPSTGGGGVAGVSSFNARTGAVSLTSLDVTNALTYTPVASGGALGTPSSGTLTNCTGLPVSTGVAGLGTGVATALAVNVGSAGALVTFGGALGTPSSGTLTNCTADGTNAVGYRNIPQDTKTGSYTLLASDVGKSIPNTTGGWTVDNSVFAAGDVVLLYNNSGSDQTITQGSGVTLRLAGTATTGSRTLAQRGLATLYFNSASDVVCSGPGVT